MRKETQRQVYEGRKDTNRQDIRGEETKRQVYEVEGGDKETVCKVRKETDRI